MSIPFTYTPLRIQQEGVYIASTRILEIFGLNHAFHKISEKLGEIV